MLELYLNGIVNGVVNFVLFGIVYAFRRLVHKEGLSAFLLQKGRTGVRRFIRGAGVGLLVFTLHPVVLLLLGQAQVDADSAFVWQTLLFMLAWGFGFLGVALFEEALFRGYILVRLRKHFSDVVAIGITSAIFGFVHFFSYQNSVHFWIGIANAILVSVVLAMVVIKSQSLMWAWGFHTGWNLIQTVLFAEQNWGEKLFVNVQFQESILSGSGHVPESGVLVTAVLVLLAFYVGKPFHARDAATA